MPIDVSKFDSLQSQTPRRPKCTVGLLLRSLPPKEAAALREVLAGDYRHKVISQVLRDEGHEVGDTTVRRHRAGECQCPR